METPSVVTPTSAPAMASAPAPAPAPAINPAPAQSTTPMVNMDAGSGTPMMESGGSTSSGGFFSNINWVETGALILGFAGLYYLIYYYRYKLNQDKLINNEMQRQIDEIKMNLQTKMNGKYKTM